VASQSILLEIIGITMFMFLAIVHMATVKARRGVVMAEAVVVMARVMIGIKSL